MASTAELQNLSKDEESAFELMDKAIELIDKGLVRMNCLDSSGMNLLDQAAFKGNEYLAKQLLDRGANADNRAHSHGYTCLIVETSGKPTLCEMLLNAGARPQATNNMNKTASELAAFVAQHECSTLINSYICREEIDNIVHPQGTQNDQLDINHFVEYIHELTRTHYIHPVTIINDLRSHSEVLEHRKQVVFVVDTLFERQMRSKNPNELWLVLTTLKEVVKFLKTPESSDKSVDSRLKLFVKRLSAWKELDGVVCRVMLEKFLCSATLGFPYQHSLLYKALERSLKDVRPGFAPNVFTVICGTVFGQRFAVLAGFCSFCGKPNPAKRCSVCKIIYCSEECQKTDWHSHKSVCHNLRDNVHWNAYKKPIEENVAYISPDDINT